MTEYKKHFTATRAGIITAGAVIGILAPLLQKLGNPPNMGICVACFERDIAGALGLHRAAVVQYLRPEIIGFVLGALFAALLFREFKARSGSSPLLRFILGNFAMIGALAFLGCPWRALLRLAGGDLNAITGLLGLAAGITIGVQFLKSGYSLGRSYRSRAAVGWAMPALMLGLLLLAVFTSTVQRRRSHLLQRDRPGCHARASAHLTGRRTADRLPRPAHPLLHDGLPAGRDPDG